MGAIYTGETSKKKLEELEQKIDAKANSADIIEGGKIKTSLLPSYVDDTIEGYYNNNAFYATRTGTAGVGNRHTYKIEFKAIRQREFMQFLYNS